MTQAAARTLPLVLAASGRDVVFGHLHLLTLLALNRLAAAISLTRDQVSVGASAQSSVHVERTDGLSEGDAADRLGQQLGDAELADLAAGLRAASDSGMVSVTTSSSSCDLVMFSIAAPDSTGCVQYATTLIAPCVLQRRGRRAQRARGIDDVVDQHAGLAADVADDVHHRGDVRLADGACR